MTREEAQEYLRAKLENIEFIKAYADGKNIEMKDHKGRWAVLEQPCFDAPAHNYRVRPSKEKEETTERPLNVDLSSLEERVKKLEEVLLKSQVVPVPPRQPRHLETILVRMKPDDVWVLREFHSFTEDGEVVCFCYRTGTPNVIWNYWKFKD